MDYLRAKDPKVTARIVRIEKEVVEEEYRIMPALQYSLDKEREAGLMESSNFMLRVWLGFMIFLGLSFSSSGLALDEGKQQKLVKVEAKPESRMSKVLLHEGVYFKNLKDGQTVSKKFKVEFGVHGMNVKPAGRLEIGTGHHHVLINADREVLKNGFPKDQVIPADEAHIHFGKGQEETELTLKSGKHTLTLQFANGAHLSYGKKWSKTITIHVK